MRIVKRAEQQICESTLDGLLNLCDEIVSEQPLVMAYVLALTRHHVSIPLASHMLNLLMVIYASFKTAMVPLATITREMLAQSLRDTRAMAHFYIDEPCESERMRLLELDIRSYPEPFLLIHWITYSKRELLKQGVTPAYSDESGRVVRRKAASGSNRWRPLNPEEGGRVGA